MPQLTPKHFSFNSHLGACPACHGLGTESVFDCDLMIPDPEKTLGGRRGRPVAAKAGNARCSNSTPACSTRSRSISRPRSTPPTPMLPERIQARALLRHRRDARIEIVLGRRREGDAAPNGRSRAWSPQMQRLYEETESELTRNRLRQYMSRQECSVCGGARLRPEILAVTVRRAGRHRS